MTWLHLVVEFFIGFVYSIRYINSPLNSAFTRFWFSEIVTPSFWLVETWQSTSGSISVILVINKIDCAPSDSSEWINSQGYNFNKRIFTCAVTGQGIMDLETAIIDIVGLNKIPAGGRKWAVNQVSSLLMEFSLLSFKCFFLWLWLLYLMAVTCSCESSNWVGECLVVWKNRIIASFFSF